MDPERQREAVAPETSVENIVIVTPNSPLPIAEKWVLHVLKGLPNSARSATLGADLAYRIGKVEAFKRTDVSAVVGRDTPREISVTFNEALPENFPANLVSVSPEIPGMVFETDGKTLSIKGDFSGQDDYVVSVGKGVESAGGRKLSNPGNQVVKFGRVSPELALPSEDEAQLAKGLRKYAIDTVNISKVKIRIKRLSGKGTVRAFQGYRNYTGNGPDWKGIEDTAILPYSLVPGETLVEKEIETGVAVDTGKTIEFAWDEILPAGTEFGTLFVDVEGVPHVQAGSSRKHGAQAIVQLTDLGFGWKFTDGSAMLFAFSCETGKPLPGVKIGTFGEDARKLTSVETDASGLATVPRGSAVRHLQATLGEDSYVVAFDKSLDQVGLWHFPVKYSWVKQLPETRRAFLFTERSLYRPGEKVRLKGIVRDQVGNAITQSRKSPARVVIVDPKEKEILTREVTLSALGSFDLEFVLPEETTGDHEIRLEFPEDLAVAEKTEDWEIQAALEQSATFSLPLKVEEFRRNTFEVTQTIDPPAIGADEISARLTATYYQGQPVAAGKADTFTQITTINPYPERYRDFLFGNHKKEDWRYWYHYFGYRDSDDDEITSTSLDSELVLSAEGKTEIPVKLPQSDFPSAREISVGTEVTDSNNQTLTARSSVTVHPAALYAGVSRVDRLIRVGDETLFRLVVTDTAGKPAGQDVTLTATVTRQVHTNTKTTNENGDTVTESEPSEEVISTSDVIVTAADSAKEGVRFPVKPTKDGLYFLTLKGKDAEGREFATATRFHVYGAKEYPWQYEDGMRIKLVSEKKSYKAGDVARILVLSPIEGTALVTVEREKVLSSYLTELKAENPVIEIPITEDHAPNAYVSILIVKGSAESAREIKEPQLRLGYCELIVENQRDRLAVAIDPAEESYRPGTEVKLTGTVSSADGKPAVGAEVTFYAVDEGTLAVMGYDSPEPMSYFYDRRLLAVDAGTSFHNFISENSEYRSFHNKGFFVGGGGDLSKLADLFRKNFDPCAAWAPALVTDAEGKYSHTFTLPDTLTRYRVLAIVHHGGAKFGSTESSIIVKKPLMLEPKLPRFANQGDVIDGRVLVQNASEVTATWEISCATGTGEGTPVASLAGPATQSLTLAPGDSSGLVFPINIGNTGNVTVSFRAKPLSLMEGSLSPDQITSLSDAVQETFVSSFPMPLLRQVTPMRTAAASSTDLRGILSKDLANANGTVEFEFASSPLVEISSSVDYLLQYPYGCAEQTSSSMMPWLAVENLRPYVPSLAKYDDRKVKSAISTGVGRLLSMQLADGSFGYWPGATETNEWVTPYAGMVLTLAARHGGNVPESALESLSQYLIKSLRGAGESTSASELENHSRSLYTLALLGKAQTPYHSLMAEKIPFLNGSSRALLAAAVAIGSDGSPKILALADQILTSKAGFSTGSDKGYWMPGNADTASVLIARLAIDPDSEAVFKTFDKLLNERNPYGHWRSTWMNGWSLLAVSNYAATRKISEEPVRFVLGDREVIIDRKTPSKKMTLQLTPATDLMLTSDQAGYVRMKVAAKPNLAPFAPVANNGLSIERFYEKVLPSGQPEVLTNPAPGDLIRITLQVTLPDDDTRYLVVDDPMPSIFETVNSDFSSQSAAQDIRTSEKDWNISHSELRTDRAVFFMDHVSRKGTYKLTYLARCTLAGAATAPPAKVESMYDPEKFALSATRKFTTK